MRVPVILGSSLLIVFCAGAQAQESFRYYAPGDLVSGQGRANDRTIYFPNIVFPLGAGPAINNAHAYANSQVHPISPPGNSAKNYVYPWHDTFCEERQWSMPLCPGKTGHQGVDIRPQSPQNATWPVFAVDDGVVTQLTTFTTVEIRSGSNDPYRCRCLARRQIQVKRIGR